MDWGDEFREAHNLAYPDTQAPRLSVGIGMVGMDYILNYGGAGYFPERMVERYIDQERLFYVDGAPTFTRPVYLCYPKDPINSELLDMALETLQQVVKLGQQ